MIAKEINSGSRKPIGTDFAFVSTIMDLKLKRKKIVSRQLHGNELK
jgi:hypothetical protein